MIARSLPLIRAILVAALLSYAASALPAEPKILGWRVAGEERAAIVYPPSIQDKHNPPPLVFVFHGHGDNAWFATEQFPFQTLWPEAVVVFPQGLHRSAASDPNGERRGWQHLPGEFGDRDLKLFDAMLRTLRGKFHVDERRIYAAGFSNGGFFDYILWSQRANIFAAFAPCAAAIRDPLQITTPKPVFVVAGERDDRVLFPEQRKTITLLRQINGCAGDSHTWQDPRATRYSSVSGPPVIAFVHERGHAVPHAATVLITEFFKQQTLSP